MIKKKNILFLTNWYPTRENQNFGIFVKRHAECLAQNYKVTVYHLLFENGALPLKITAQVSDINENTYVIRFSGILYKFLYYMPRFVSLVVQKKIRAFQPEIKFDIIVSNVLFNAGIVGYFLSKKMKLKQVHIEHWSGIEKFIRRNFLRKKGLKALNNSSEIIVVSNQLKETLKFLEVSTNSSVVPNVISSYFKYKQVARTNEQIIFLAVANWGYPKRLDLIIESLNLLKLKNPTIEFKLILIGTGPLLTKDIENQIKFETERIETVDNLNLPEFYNKADFLLHFSDFETFSIVPLEALACGCPVIASRVGVLPEYINDSNGIIVENDTLEILASLEKSIQIKYSRINISDQIANKFSKDYVSKLFKEIIDEI